ncbi:hypothetical protein SLEP1_g7014 [Rubroshorea leprosula]|uniref:Uncharacterized protein n=1 Tax=Rubroshorea leprosula TaxID=152421 RepID=A0AAV5I2V7_9ROSI|nr:hypothetical protein SLEP1_g7014 [Rubroshorea leprosula]
MDLMIKRKEASCWRFMPLKFKCILRQGTTKCSR